MATACATWPPSEGRSRAIRDALDRPLDWESFVVILKRHRITGFAHHVLTSLPEVGARVPPNVRANIGNEALAVAGAHLQLLAETGRLQRLFSADGVPAIFLKGVPLAILAYRNFAVRHSKDIDLLVSMEHLAGVARILQAEGYIRVTGPPTFRGSLWQLWLREFHHCSYVHRRTGVEIELHWRLFRNPRLLPLVPGEHQRGVVHLPDGTAVPTLSDEDLFAYLCAHGTQHNWFRLKWLADIGALLNQRSEDEIEHMYDAACDRGATLFTAHAMLLANRILNAPLPSSLLERLRSVPGTSRLDASAMATLLGRGFQTEPSKWGWRTTAQYQWHGFRLPGWRYRVAQARLLLISQEDVQAFSLPSRAAFVYPLIRGPRWLWQQIRQMLQPARIARSRPRP